MVYLYRKSCLKNVSLDNNHLHVIKLAFDGSKNCDSKLQAQIHGLYILMRSFMRFTNNSQHTKLSLLLLKKYIVLIRPLMHFNNYLSTLKKKVEFQVYINCEPSCKKGRNML